MSLVRMSIQTVVASSGPATSLVVLCPQAPYGPEGATLPIRIGNYEAAAISTGLGNNPTSRPLTHDLLAATIAQLGAKLNGVSIIGARGTTFYAQLMLVSHDGSTTLVDSRPSDAIALAVRMHAPIYADDSVLRMASMPNFKLVEADVNATAIKEFHDFVEGLSPADFS